MSKTRPGMYVLEDCGTKNAPIRWWDERGLYTTLDEAIGRAWILKKEWSVAWPPDGHGGRYVRVRLGLAIKWCNWINIKGGTGWPKNLQSGLI